MSLSQTFRLPAQWTLQHENPQVAQYINAAGDLLTVNYFGLVPDIACDVRDLDALRAFYRRMSEANGLAMLEAEQATVDGVAAVQTLYKARMAPRGFAFIGAYTLPFAQSSYVLKVQSTEQGITGAREAAVMMLGEPPKPDAKTGKLIGWAQDPYDPSYQGAFMRNQADDARHDALFPDHPLSKVRRYLAELQAEVQLAEHIKQQPAFVYGEPATTAQPWWKFWR